MRHLHFTSLSLATLALAACGGNPPGADENASENAAGPAEYFTIRAGAITDARADSVSGNFQLQRTGPPRGVESDGLGGACIVFAAASLNFPNMAAKRCNTNSECSTPGENAFGYCDAQSHTCWARPVHQDARTALCNLGFVITPGAINPVPAQPADVSRFGIEPGAQARVVACLNKKGFVPGPAPNGTGCAGTGADALQDFGLPAPIR